MNSIEVILVGLYVVLSIFSVVVLLKTIDKYRILKANIWNAQARMCLLNIDENVLNSDEFFLMKNSGANPCDEVDEIQYVNYIDENEDLLWR